MKNRQDDVESILSALDNKDFDSIRVLAHRMKGSGEGYGFPEISRIGCEMELTAKKNDINLLTSLVKKMATFLEEVKIGNG